MAPRRQSRAKSKSDQPCIKEVEGTKPKEDASAGEAGIGSNSSASCMPTPYVEVYLPDGRLARQCRASDDCPQQFHFELVRRRMERHLQRQHGLEVHIPLRKGGRPPKEPIGSRAKPPQTRVDHEQIHKQAKARFKDKDRKFALNMKKAENLHRLRASQQWDNLKPEFRTSSKEEFVEKIARERMTAYLASSKERLARIQKRIDEGYEKYARKKQTKELPPWLNVMMDDIDEENLMGSCEDKEIKEDQESDSHETLDGRTSSIDVSEESLENETSEEHVEEECSKHDEGLVMQKRQKLKIRSFVKTHVVTNVKTQVVTNVSSSPEGDSKIHVSLKFIIQNGHIFVMEEGAASMDLTKGNIAVIRLASDASITFSSMRFKLSIGVDQRFVNDILHDEASTRTMNLFGQWMEHALSHDILRKIYIVDSMWYLMDPDVLFHFILHQSSGIDMSQLVFCFWPVVCRNHWSLFVLYVNRGEKLARLPKKKHCLLYLDSLKLTNPLECLERLHSGIRSLVQSMADSDIRRALECPSKLELELFHVPQQSNGSDCGFYVMKFIRDLIAGGLEDRPSHGWLTENWFNHLSVCELKRQLHHWCMQVLALEA